MFRRLREKIADFAKRLAATIETRELSDRELDEALENFKLELLESDVAFEVAEMVCDYLKKRLASLRVSRSAKVEDVLREAFASFLREHVPEPFDVLESAREACAKNAPFVMMVMGVNGVGKTTSIAKLAKLFKDNGLSVLLVAADTFRAGAQEQLAKHAENLGVPVIKAAYGKDPAAVAYDAVQHAKKRKYCVVIVDTAGRMHTDADLMSELRKIARVVNPNLKLLVVDALTGNDAVEQARAFNAEVGVDGFFLTKTDADAKGGAAISISIVTKKPILFVGTGQRYSDVEPFTKEWLLNKLAGGNEGG